MPTLTVTHELETAAQLRTVIGRLSRRLRSTAAARDAGLTPTAISLLLTVARIGRVRLSELAESEGINPTMLSRAIAGMVQDGLLSRVSDEGDRRAAWVEATAAGRRLAERMRRERTSAVNHALETLPEADRRRIERALPALEALSESLKGRSL
ncbi:MAG TPA: MarR family transcriptional regulator [Solirubrobacteraceae bacterium]|nr:MarR family transcriptional regulator [Solirubrobacteraceae bacterium]